MSKPSPILFLIILAVACLGQFAADIYSPSIPALSNHFHATINLVQLSLSIYMFGVALSLLFYGPISEGFGRKLPLIIGLMIMLIGTVICVTSPNIHMLIFGRFIQGLGAGAGSGLWRAIFRDIFRGEALAKYISYFTVIVVFVVPAAPLIGGYLQHYIGWESIFIFLFAYSLLTLLLVVSCFSETSKHHHIERLKINYIIQTFKKLFCNRIYLVTTICVFFSYGAFFSWFIVGPVLIIEIIGITPVHFGWMSFIATGLGLVLAGLLNAQLVEHYGITTMMRLGWSVMICSGIIMLIGYLLCGVNLWAIFLPTILCYLGAAFIWPNANAKAMTPFGDIAGYAGTMYSFMKFFGSAVITGAVSHLPDHNQVPLACIYIICPLISLLTYNKFLIKKTFTI